jgi:small neutral amino acid transporter SnatA (MarC family)
VLIAKDSKIRHKEWEEVYLSENLTYIIHAKRGVVDRNILQIFQVSITPLDIAGGLSVKYR